MESYYFLTLGTFKVLRGNEVLLSSRKMKVKYCSTTSQKYSGIERLLLLREDRGEVLLFDR